MPFVTRESLLRAAADETGGQPGTADTILRTHSRVVRRLARGHEQQPQQCGRANDDRPALLPLPANRRSLADSVFASDLWRPFLTCAPRRQRVRAVKSCRIRVAPVSRPLLEEEIAINQKAYARARTRNVDHEGRSRGADCPIGHARKFFDRMEFVAHQFRHAAVSAYELASGSRIALEQRAG